MPLGMGRLETALPPTRTLHVTVDGDTTPLRTRRGRHYAVGDLTLSSVLRVAYDETGAEWCSVDVHSRLGAAIDVTLVRPRGRPTKPPAARREERFDVRLTPSEAAAVRAAAGGEAVGVWLRGLVLRELNATHPTLIDILAPLLEDLVRHEGDPVVWAPGVKASDVRAGLEQGNRATQAAAATLLRAAVRRYVREHQMKEKP